MKSWVLFLGAWIFLSGNLWAAPAEPVSVSVPEVRQILNELEEKMRLINSMQTRFHETKKLSLFEHEMELTGSIAMEKPDRFAWRTQTPLKYAIVFDKDKVSQWDEDRRHAEALSFSNSPVLKMVMEQMRIWFYGTYGELMGQYAVALVSREPLALKFTPEEKSPAFGMIQSVTLQFKDDRSYIESIRIDEKNGDFSVLRFTDTALNLSVSPDVWKAEKNG